MKYQVFVQENKEKNEREYEQDHHYFKILNFAYTYAHLRKIIQQDINIQSFPSPLSSENTTVRAEAIMQRLELPHNHNRFIRSLLREFKFQIIWCCLLVLIDFALKIINSILMGSVIRFMTTKEVQIENYQQRNTFFHKILIGFFCSLFLGIYSKLWVYHYCSELGAKIRITIIQTIYTKTTKLSASILQDFGVGRLMNLVSNDLNDFDNGLVWTFQLLVLPLNLIVATLALWRSFQVYSIVGLIVLIISLKIQDMISKTVKQPIKQKNKISDKRIYYSKQMVKNIKTVKMYTWEKEILEIIQQLRRKEIQLNFNIMLNQGISKILSYLSLLISVLAMVVAKLALQPSLLQNDSIYASIGIFGVIRNSNFNGGLNYFMSLRIILQRVDEFMRLNNIRQRSIYPIVYVSTEPRLESEVQRLQIIEGIKYTSSKFAYLFKTGETIPQLLASINFQENSKIFIYGASGSGKTSLIQSFLNESKYYKVQNLKGTLGYASQEPILFNNTVKENILFGKAFDDKKFETVIKICCLEKDMEAFPQGKDTLIEMGGASFSGGQKARIALARTLYSNAQILILDNCLSALDPKIRKIIHKNLFSENLGCKGIIFATSASDEILEDSLIFQLQEKQIKYIGKFDPIMIPKQNHMQEQQQKPQEVKKRDSILPQSQQLLLIQDEGHIENETYFYYLKHFGENYKGIFKIFIVISLFVLCELSVLTFYKNLPLLNTDTWVRLKSIGNYLTMYLCLDYLRMYVMVVLASTNSMRCHRQFMKQIAYANYSWYFKKQPELINVFGNHIGIIDRPLPNIIYDVVKGLLSNAIYIISMCIVTPIFIPLAVILTLGFWLVKAYLRQYIRKCKIFELKYRSPVNNKLSEVFNGVTVIRAFHVEKDFKDQFNSIIYDSQRTFFAFVKMNRFFDFVLQLIVFLMIVLGITFTFAFNQIGSEKSSNLALSVFTLISMTSQLSYNIRQTLSVELNLISLQKVLSYKDVPQENIVQQYNHKEDNTESLVESSSSREISMIELDEKIKGKIEFKNVKMKYPGSNSYCLKDFNLVIPEGQKVALMGRTGAGKSSVFLALYRLFEIEPESSILINGKDIRDIDLLTLRRRYLSVSAQDPIKLIPLTSDASPSQLKYESITNRSNTPIKLLDQPFANIDSQLQEKIWVQLKKMSTVIAVVHSGNLDRWQRILILADGKVISDSQNRIPQSQKILQKSQNSESIILIIPPTPDKINEQSFDSNQKINYQPQLSEKEEKIHQSNSE